MPDSPKKDTLHSVSHLPDVQSRELALAPETTSSGTFFNTERFFITPNLVILISPSGSVGNTTALSDLLFHAVTYAQSKVLRYGASRVLPGRIRHKESDLEYEVQPPLPRASSRFTWGQYEAVTDWLYNYLVVVGYEAYCAFNIKEVLDGGRESQIGFGEVHVFREVGGGPRNRTVGDGNRNSNGFARLLSGGSGSNWSNVDSS